MNDQNSDRKLREALGISPSSRKIVVWRGPEDVGRLTEAIAQAGSAHLFEREGALIWRHEGKPIVVTRNLMKQIIAGLIEGVRLVFLETSTELEYLTFDFLPGADTSREPDDSMLTIIMRDLVRMVAAKKLHGEAA